MRIKFINATRRNGKTALMIYLAYTIGYPIIVIGQQRKELIKKQAQELCCDGIDIYTVEEWRKFKYSGRDAYYKDNDSVRKVFIDETEDLLKKILDEYFEANVVL